MRIADRCTDGALMTISSKSIDSGSRPLPWLLALYGLASLAHFIHNAEYLGAYPNLPA